ncbi:MAG: 2-oxoisovalerate dehydrogenase [Planctomycetes bacterium]|nr:2-oxoisovalerate dehydrogenase [Planctomycetota bacterium]MCL4731371.1 2-oxoisovalerate dehydrogenase [Planctomycetota bacterium]
MARTKAAPPKNLDLPPNYVGHERAWFLLNLGRLIDDEAPNFLRKAMGWSYHAPNAGHDAIQLALGATFRPGKDHLFPYYRDLTTALAAGITAKEAILNGLSRDEDIAGGGRHMSNHFAKPAINVHNVSSCVSNHIQHAAGLGLAIKKYGTDSVVYCSFGESSTSEGYVYEALNAISKDRLPVVTVIQDNGYGISVPKRDQSANECLADNFAGLAGARIWRVDGRDVIACFTAMHEATEYARTGKGCAIVYAFCVRIGSHSNSDNHVLYRDEKELAEAKARDPLPVFRKWLTEEAGVSESRLDAIAAEAKAEFEAARAYGENAPRPDPKTATEFVFAPAHEPGGNGVPDSADHDFVEHFEAKKGMGLTLRQGINAALRREFRDNPDTFLWGQDIANREKEGIFLVTKGMQKEFGPGRVFNAPIAENWIMGAANGFSRLNPKIRVVVEGAEFADYFWPAMDQFVECAHDYYRTRGQFTPNVIIRLASGGYIGGGLYHSQTIEGSLCNIPGVRIVYPAFADDAYGLMRTAMKSRGPTLFLEPKGLYNDPRTRAHIPNEFHVPFGKARVRRQGSDVVVFSYGNAVHMALKAAEELAGAGSAGVGTDRRVSSRGNPDGADRRAPEMVRAADTGDHRSSDGSGTHPHEPAALGNAGNRAGGPVSVAVVDLRSLVPLDEETILHWVQKTGRVVIAHEGPEFGGFGGEVAALIAKKAFRYLDAPVERVGARFSPVPFSTVLEAAVLPQPGWIKQTIEAVAAF